MGYPAKLLNPGETIAIDVRPHWRYLAGPLFATAVVVVGGIVALVESIDKWALVAIAAVLVVVLVWLGVRYVKWTTTTFVVTNQRLILRRGVFKREGREILLDRLTDISYDQTFMDRILGCGDILIESPGRDSQERFEDLPHPVRIQNEIYRLVAERQAPPAGGGVGPLAPAAGVVVPAAGAPGAAVGTVVGTPAADGGELSVAEQLSQLDDLRKRKVISRKEFAAKKAELLSRM
jgi:membrane protein YdbS with pleckstrin-like domain